MTTELVQPLDQAAEAELVRPPRPHRWRVTHPAPDIELGAARDEPASRAEFLSLTRDRSSR